jgi:hypothetical protein
MKIAISDNDDRIKVKDIPLEDSWIGLCRDKVCYLLCRIDTQKYGFVCLDRIYRSPICCAENPSMAIGNAIVLGWKVFILEDINDYIEFIRLGLE